jgi:hypothetical protein
VDDAQLERLRFIQAIISRMGQNGFLIKGWAVTAAAALLGIAVERTSAELAYVALAPIVAFAALDSYYLGRERTYRSLYEAVCEGRPAETMSLDASAHRPRWATARAFLTSPPVLIQYVSLAALTLFVAIVIHKGGLAPESAGDAAPPVTAKEAAP